MQLNFKESGQGRAVILLHGLFGSLDNWHQVNVRLAETFQVFAVDQRNHGQSPHAAEMNYPLMAADVNEFMSAQRLERAHVIGHSMGGKTAMQLALQFPGRVEKLVVADMAPRAYPPAHEKILAALLALNLPTFTTRQEMEDALATEISGLVLRRFLLKNLGRDAHGKFFWKMNLQSLSDNYLELGKPVSGSAPFAGPALFVRGERSDYVNPGDGTLIRELFPRSEIQTIAGAGHWLTTDKPEEFLRLVLGFL